jgi:hypothetical protein
MLWYTKPDDGDWLRNVLQPFTCCRDSRLWRTFWIVDAHGYGKRFIVRADEKLTAFVELERAVCIHVLTQQI